MRDFTPLPTSLTSNSIANHMSLQINIKVTDTVTPVLAQLHEELCDRTEQHGYIAFAAEAEMSMHIEMPPKTEFMTTFLETCITSPRWRGIVSWSARLKAKRQSRLPIVRYFTRSAEARRLASCLSVTISGTLRACVYHLPVQAVCKGPRSMRMTVAGATVVLFYQPPPRALIRRTVEMWRWAEICAVWRSTCRRVRSASRNSK
jgi:hypothetical protein